MPDNTLGNRIRTLRITNGLTIETAARTTGVCISSWRAWEAGTKQPRLIRGLAIASALNVPVAALFRDGVVADVVVSADTVQRIRAEGRAACEEVARRLASQLEPAIYEMATRKPRDISAGSRARPRRTRVEKLAGVEQANAMRRAALERRRQPVVAAAV